MLGECGLQTNLDRTHFPPWGVQGGKEASPGRFTVVDGRTGTERADREGKRASGSRPVISSVSRPAAAAAMVRRAERSLDLIQRDLDAGYVSAAAAMRDYGVTVGAEGKARR